MARPKKVLESSNESPEASEVVFTQELIQGDVNTEEHPVKEEPSVKDKIQQGLTGLSGIKVKQSFVLKCANSLDFMQRFQHEVQKGAVLKDDVYPSLSFPFTAYMIREIDIGEDEYAPVENPYIRATPIKREEFVFGEEELSKFSLGVFRKVVAKWGITGKDRKIMTNEYLKLVGDLLK